MYPAANPAPSAAKAPAATAKARVSTEYAAGGGSAARTSGPEKQTSITTSSLITRIILENVMK